MIGTTGAGVAVRDDRGETSSQNSQPRSPDSLPETIEGMIPGQKKAC